MYHVFFESPMSVITRLTIHLLRSMPLEEGRTSSSDFLQVGVLFWAPT